ncbi:MAG: DUF6671 family protein [Lishizhenia sp.]
MAHPLFQGRTIVIATQHKKESVIAPILETELGLKCILPEDFDTDHLGTFSGEVERVNSPLETVREKCLNAMKQANCDLGIASEGSFGAHPVYGFVASDDELVILIDQKNDLEIVARNLTTETNFSSALLHSETELFEFAENVNFPSHAIILRNAQNGVEKIIKGIQHLQNLKTAFFEIYTEFNQVFAETDMRALYNPTRMNAIKIATQNLIKKIDVECPSCKTPGFDVSDVNKGLPCSDCGFPTRSTLSVDYLCKKCGFQKNELYPNKKEKEDPTYCDICNP